MYVEHGSCCRSDAYSFHSRILPLGYVIRKGEVDISLRNNKGKDVLLFLGLDSFHFIILCIYNTHTHSEGLICVSDQPDAKTSTPQHKTRETSMFPVGFEPAIPTSEPRHTHALDRAATGISEVALVPN